MGRWFALKHLCYKGFNLFCKDLGDIKKSSDALSFLFNTDCFNKGFSVINNDILRRVRFTFDFNDDKMMLIFKLGGLAATREQISDWLKRDEDPAFKKCTDTEMAVFLNGLIIKNRGAKDIVVPEPESRLNNNLIFRKLKIALNMKDDDVLRTLTEAGFPISKHELSAFFRSPTHKHYRECKDQLLRSFLKGLQLKKVDKTT